MCCNLQHCWRKMWKIVAKLIGSLSVADIHSTNERLQQCVVATQRWCLSCRLQLNPSKMVLIWFGTWCSLQKITASDRFLQINDHTVISDKPVVHDLGVLLDSELTIKRYINQVARNCFHHIRRLKQIRWLLGPEITVKPVTSLTYNRLD